MSKNIVQITYIDGFFLALMVASTESYAIYHFTKLGVTGMQLAQLTTVPIVIASIIQYFLPRYISQEKIGVGLIAAQLVQAVGLVGLYLCVTQVNFSFVYALISLCLYWAGGQNAGPLWIDFFSNLVNMQRFSSYFSRRNRFISIITMVLYILFSYVLSKSISLPVLFLIGLNSRIISSLINAFLYMMYFKPKNKSIIHQVNNQTSKEAGEERGEEVENKKIIYRFFLWGGLFRLSVNIASPFFIIYMIRDLQLSTPSYVWLTAIPLLGRAIFIENWARASSYNKAVWGIQISTFFISFIPIFWNFSSNYTYLIVLQLCSGLFWGGIELTQILMLQNFSYGNTRHLQGVQQFVFTIFSLLGAGIGGYLLDRGISINNLFYLSSGFRLMVAIALVYSVSYFKLSKLSLREGTQYLINVLSIRPSLVSGARYLIFDKKLLTSKASKSPKSPNSPKRDD